MPQKNTYPPAVTVASDSTWQTFWTGSGAGTSWGALNFALGNGGWYNIGAAGANAVAIRRFLASEYAVAGTTMKMRVRAAFLSNPTAPGISFDVGLYEPATIGGGSGTLSFGAFAAINETTITTPAASTITTANTTEIDFPTSAKNLCMGVQPTGSATAGHYGVLTLVTEIRWV